MLIKYEVTRTTMPEQSNRPFSFRIHKEGAAGLHLAAENEEATTRWIAVISHAVEKCSQVFLNIYLNFMTKPFNIYVCNCVTLLNYSATDGWMLQLET